MTTINFSKPLPLRCTRLKDVLLGAVAAGTAEQKQRALYDLAQSYRHGTSLTRADVTPGASGATLKPLADVFADLQAAGGLRATLDEAMLKYPTVAGLLSTFEDDLLSDVQGRVVTAASALVIFLLREVA